MNQSTPSTNTTTTDALVAEYLEYLAGRRRDTTRPRTSLRLFVRYLEHNGLGALAVRPGEAQGFQTALALATDPDGSLHYARGSVCGIVAGTSAFYDYLVKRRCVPANPFRNIERLKRHRHLPRTLLCEADMDRLLGRLKRFMEGRNLLEKKQLYRAHLIAEMLYSTGARIHEIVGLALTDVDLSRGMVRLTDRKTRTIREGILNSFTAAILAIYVERTRAMLLNGRARRGTLLFGTDNVSHMSGWLRTIIRRESVTLGIEPFTNHAIRHAVGYHLLKHGCDIRYIQELLGHRRLGTTQGYTRVDKEDLKRVLDTYHPRRR